MKNLFWFDDKFNNNNLIFFFINYWIYFLKKNKLINSIICQFINNYYQTDIFCKNSKIISICGSKLIIKNWNYIKVC